MADISEDEKENIQQTLTQSGFRPLNRTERRSIWINDYEFTRYCFAILGAPC